MNGGLLAIRLRQEAFGNFLTISNAPQFHFNSTVLMI